MWLFFVNGLLYVFYTAFSGEWRYLLPNRKSYREAWLVLLHDLHIKKGLPPQRKYNAAQRIAYTSIIIMGLGSIVTGLSIYKPVQFGWLASLCGGYEAARLEHFVLTIGYCVFFLVHLVQVILAGWKNFRSMVTGFDVMHLLMEDTLPKEDTLYKEDTLPKEDPPGEEPSPETAIITPVNA
jgi:thiosulfate reductase cytochrome b subunit